ncbi:MAG: efflux RND transporter periplasmic adaptor subunit [Cyanobacteria bacterium P01_A01_bin.105]
MASFSPSETGAQSGTESRKSRFNWRWLLPLMLLPIVWPVRFSTPTATAETPPTEALPTAALPVATQRVTAESAYTVERAYTGEIVARRSSSLGFEQAGTLIAVQVEEGDTVAAGAPLARLDTRSLQTQRQQLEAQRRQATARFDELQQGPRQEAIAAAQSNLQDLQSQLSLARLQQQRREDLYQQGAISLEERDEKVYAANALQNRVNQATSQLAELQTGTRREQLTAQAAQVDQIDASIRSVDVALSKSVLYAPFAGRVSQRQVDEGTVVAPGQSVLTLVEGTVLEARVGVPASAAADLSLGSPQTLTVSGQTLEGTVTALLPELDETSQTVTVVVTLAPETSLTLGSTARLLLSHTEAETGFWLTTDALVSGERGLWSAYVLTTPDENAPDGVSAIAKREVEVLYTDGDRSFVRGLLQSGDQIVTSGTHRIVPGQLVRP